MPRILDEIRRKLSRIFLCRIIVREVSGMRREVPAKIASHFRSVEVKPMRVEPRVSAALFMKWKSSKAKTAGSLMNLKGFSGLAVRSVEIKMSHKPGVKRYKLNLKRRAEARSAVGRINRMPSQRSNRINFLKNPPKIERATLLALYTPIYQEKVFKSALDKSSGNLLFWYDNKRVKMGDKYHLLLLRVFGEKEPLKWVWLPADKKIG